VSTSLALVSDLAPAKLCRRCKRVLPIAQFYRNKTKPLPHLGACRECVNAEYKRHRAAHPERFRRYERTQNLKRKYGITIKQFEAMLAAQGGTCAVCAGPPLGKGNQYHVDHDHRTGRIRGILCHKCNVALGLVSDSPLHLRALIAYLERKA
jgi:hypothetical protein